MMSRPATRWGFVVGLLLIAHSCVGPVGVGRSNRAYTAAPGQLSPEGHRVWSRPNEITYETGEPITGEAWHVSLLWGSLSIGDDVLPAYPIVGDIMLLTKLMGGGDSGLVASAVASAVQNNDNADGIYLQSQKTSGFSFLGLVTFRQAKVYGRAMKLKIIGEVDQERADRERYLRALGGNAEVPLPGLGERLFGPTPLLPAN